MINRPSKYDLDFMFSAVIFILVSAFMIADVWAEQVLTVRLSDEKVALVRVSTRGTVLSFPVKPTKVILGKSGSFGIEYVENDLAISPLSLTARSNLFVYLYGRRFSFDLLSSPSEGSAVILIRDALDPAEAKPKPQTKSKRLKK